MADKSLIVTIGADTASLEAKSAVAKASLTAVKSEMTALAKASLTASEEMKAGIEAELAVVSQKFVVVKESAQLAAAAIKEASAASNEVHATGFASVASAISAMGERAEATRAKLSEFTTAFSAVGELALVGLGLESVADQIKDVAEAGAQLNQLSEKTGLTVQALQGLKVVAGETDTQFDMVGTALTKLANNMQEAVQSPTSKAAAAFREFGISVTDASGNLRPLGDVADEVATKMSGFSAGAAKDADMADFFGAKVGANLIPFIDALGEVHLAGAIEKSNEFGAALSKAGAVADEQFMGSLADAKTGIERLRDTVVQGAIPGLTVLATDFTELTERGGLLHDAAVLVGTGFDALVIAADVAMTVLVDVGAVATASVITFESLAHAAEAAGDAMKGDFKAAGEQIRAEAGQTEQAWSSAFQKINIAQSDLLQSTKQIILGASAPSPIMAGIGSHQGHDEQDAPTLDKADLDSGKVASAKSTDDQITAIATAGAEARKEIAASEYQTQVSIWDSAVEQGKMSKAAEIQDEMSAQQQIYQSQVQELQQEAAVDAAGTAAKAKALDDVAVLTAQHNAEMAKMESDLVTQQVEDAQKVKDAQLAAATATSEAWQRAVQPIEDAFDKSINGIIQGTETLRQAELKAAQSITLSFIDAEEKKLVSFLASEAEIAARGVLTELQLTSATIAGNTARLTAKTAADTTGKAEDVALGTAQINSSAYKAAAGAYSAVAGIPFVGPALAPVAGATAYAAVMAYDVLSAEGGMVIPGGTNPLVQLHEKEMVLPAYIAQPLQSMVSGGGASGDTSVTNHFNLSAPGGPGGVTADSILATLNAAVRSGSLQKYPAIARMMRR